MCNAYDRSRLSGPSTFQGQWTLFWGQKYVLFRKGKHVVRTEKKPTLNRGGSLMSRLSGNFSFDQSCDQNYSQIKNKIHNKHQAPRVTELIKSKVLKRNISLN
ncbi:hypothetical protein AMECASPLE_016785 [Ameca splendens]|uniref:Uncharacterized protein n=1 Tax=Ameca splendens TaxID=208324 RepID=A0ABV0YP76_9TELE